MNIKLSVFLFLCVVYSCVCGISNGSAATTLYVNWNIIQNNMYCGAYTHDPCSSISSAVRVYTNTTNPNKYSDGLIVVLLSETYSNLYESVDVSGLNVTITSASSDPVVIYGSSRSYSMFVAKSKSTSTIFKITRAVFNDFHQPILNFVFTENTFNSVTLDQVTVTECDGTSYYNSPYLFNITGTKDVLEIYGTSFNVKNSIFENSSSMLMGLSQVKFNVNNTLFSNNTKDIIFVTSSSTNITQTTFRSSGALVFNKGSATIDSSSFTAGYSSDYATILAPSNFKISNSVFLSNIANFAGAIQLVYTNSFNISNCNFTENSGATGGVSISYSTGVIENSLFLDNTGFTAMALNSYSSQINVINTNMTTSFSTDGSFYQLVNSDGDSTLNFQNSTLISEFLPWSSFSIVSCTQSYITLNNTLVESNGYNSNSPNHGRNILFNCDTSSCTIDNSDYSSSYQCENFVYPSNLARAYILYALIATSIVLVLAILLITCCLIRQKRNEAKSNNFIINIHNEKQPLVSSTPLVQPSQYVQKVQNVPTSYSGLSYL